jgi:hypothetical protein
VAVRWPLTANTLKPGSTVIVAKTKFKIIGIVA